MSMGLDNITTVKHQLFFESLHFMRFWKKVGYNKYDRHLLYVGYRRGCLDAEIVGSHYTEDK